MSKLSINIFNNKYIIKLGWLIGGPMGGKNNFSLKYIDSIVLQKLNGKSMQIVNAKHEKLRKMISLQWIENKNRWEIFKVGYKVDKV